jgi:hypothetical protein
MYRFALLLALLPAFGMSALAPTFRDLPCGTTVTVTSSRPSTFVKDVVARADLIVRAGIGAAATFPRTRAKSIRRTNSSPLGFCSRPDPLPNVSLLILPSCR